MNDACGCGYYLWHLMLTQQGYLVASVDNRGTPAPLGRAWRKAVYGQLGVLETRIRRAARALAQRPYVDTGQDRDLGLELRRVHEPERAVPPRISISTGGGGVAGDPLGLYDNVYTERYNGLPAENQAGYDRGSPLTYVNGSRATCCSFTAAATTTCTTRTPRC